MNQRLMDIAAIRDSIMHSGEFRVHLMWSKSGLTVKCRMWHPDGFIVGSASGGGYDKGGAALGAAIQLLFPAELIHLPLPTRNKNGSSEGLYGLSEYNGRRSLDGACGKECMLKVLRAMGFEVESYNTGKDSEMVLAKREPLKK